MHDVFISYKSEDSALAMKVVNTLEASGISCWIAERDIQTGSNYAVDIPAAIRDARFFLLLLTERAQRSAWIMKELDTAITKNKTILPLIVGNFFINETLHFMLSGVQFYVATNDPDKAIYKLVCQIHSTEASGTIPYKDINKPKRRLPKWLIPAGAAFLAVILGISIFGKSRNNPSEEQFPPALPIETTAATQAPTETTAATQTPTEATVATQTPTETTAATQAPVENTEVAVLNGPFVMIQPEYVDSSDPSNLPFWGQTQYRRKDVRTIRFQYTLDGVPSDALDVSESRDRSVLMWMENGNLTVAADGRIAPNSQASWMFSYFSNLESIDFGNHFDTSDVTTLRGMFYHCGDLTELDLSCFDTHKVVDMALMFSGCNYLENLEIGSFRTARVEDMSNMFNDCDGLVTLDLSNFDTSNVTHMGRMFAWCGSLVTLDLSGFDTSHVNDMEYMFAGCSSLTALDLSNFRTDASTDTDSMFSRCGSLTDAGLKCSDAQVLYAFSLK